MIFVEKLDQAVAKEIMEISYNEKGEERKSKMMTSFSSQQKTLKDDFLNVGRRDSNLSVILADMMSQSDGSAPVL